MRRIPSGQKWGANPATLAANLTADELENIMRTANDTHQRAKERILEFLPVRQTYVYSEELERQQV
jgi:hypothetical protein